MITAEMFKAATGIEPIQDDLERCNCDKAGQMGHSSCGWNTHQNMPVFMVGTEPVTLYHVWVCHKDWPRKGTGPVQMTKTPCTLEEAQTIASNLTIYPWREITIKEV